MTNMLNKIHDHLGWPKRGEIMSPTGQGPKVYVNLAKRKIKTALNRFGVKVVNVGVLSANSASNKTEDPLAIVCEFRDTINDDVLRETHRLAWSFSRSLMLVTVEPTLLRVWTCWRKPPQQTEDINKTLLVEEWESERLDMPSLSHQAAKSLQWIELVTGSFFRDKKRAKYFQRDQRADRLMLSNLSFLRSKLLQLGLSEDTCHDLLARIIFIEFLFRRKDSKGNAALNEKVLRKLHIDGVLKNDYCDLAGILDNHKDTYRFFRYLNSKFNGDLFPGKGKTQKERELEWQSELKEVKQEHLKELAKFIRGEMEMAKGQLCLWPQYSFDAIPLEFISSIYEEFVSKKKNVKKTKGDNKSKREDKKKSTGIHYTPGHIVDFMLDEVLPWNSKKWNLKILDPSCGSGIFLVKAYQRLVHRWKKANSRHPGAPDLRNLLENNIFGVDIDPHAVRVASFSLYLAMCDEMEPKYIWQSARFPRLRDKKLIPSDFFAEDQPGFRTSQDTSVYDLVIGNAPWGRGTASESNCAKLWVNREPTDTWSIPNLNIGPIFLVKAAALIKRNGRIAMLQPSGAMLYNRDTTANEFRRKYFTKFKIEKIINLSALRQVLFPNSNSPASIVIMQNTLPNDESIDYIFPKRSHTKEERYRIIIEPHDVNKIYPNEAAQDPIIWSLLAWGGRRDLALIQKLAKEANLGKLGSKVKNRRGIGRGKEERQDEILNMPLLESETFPQENSIYLDASLLEPNHDPWVYAGHSKDMSAFNLPQMIFKLSWRKDIGRFRAVLVKSNEKLGPVLCSFSYVSVHVPAEHHDILKSACLSLNSIVTVYFMLLSSGQFAFFIQKPNQKDFLNVPIPKFQSDLLKNVKSIDQVDDYARKAFGINDAEWILVEDLVNYTLPDFVGNATSPGRQTTRNVNENEQILGNYCDYFTRVFKAGFGKDRNISTTIFTEASKPFIPLRLVAVHLESPEQKPCRVEKIDSTDLINTLNGLNDSFLQAPGERKNGGIFYQRVVRVYNTMEINGLNVPTVFIIKPDQVRYWTRSMALRDADEVATDIMSWQDNSTFSSYPVPKKRNVFSASIIKEEKV